MTIRKSSLKAVGFRDAPFRRIAELASGRVLGAEGISLRIVEMLPLQPGVRRHPHAHLTMEEAIYVEAGRGKAWVEEEIADLEPGELILVPSGAKHMMLPVGGPMRLICCFSGPDPEERVEYPEIGLSEALRKAVFGG